MINFRTVNEYCCEDISLIENYEQAANDKTQTWDAHHRLETTLGLSKDELMKQNRYLNVPANELIFLTHSEHMKLHTQGKENPMYGKHHLEESNKKRSESLKGEKNPWWGKHQSEESNRKRSEAMKGKYKGENNPNYGRRGKDCPIYRKRWMKRENEKPIYVDIDLIEHYLSLGYHRGRK